MKLNRKLFFRIHGWIGIKLSILFFIVCFSGSLATLSHEMDWLFFPEIRAKYEGQVASHNERVSNIKKAYPNSKIIYWSSSNEPYLCDIVYVSENGQLNYVFVNPYTAEVQGAATLTFQRFFRDLHYFLFIPFQIGHFTVLIFGFMLFISITTALLFYKKWWKKLFDLKIHKGRLVFYRSLHRLVGLWSVPFAILFSITGIWYFVERTNIGGVSKTANTRSPKIEALDLDSITFATLSYDIDYDKAVEVAEQVIPGLKVKDIFPPGNDESVLYINGLSHVPLVRNRANRVFLHPLTYESIKIQRADELPAVTWLNDIADPLHFGYWGGLATKIIWFLGGLGISGLVATGLWISMKRKIKNVKKANAQKIGWWKYPNLTFVLAVLGCMYYQIITRYTVSTNILILLSLCWLVLMVMAWYVFIFGMSQKKH